jgi:hypothetical protein
MQYPQSYTSVSRTKNSSSNKAATIEQQILYKTEKTGKGIFK